MMFENERICQTHGKLEEKDIRVIIQKGYKCRQCRLCNKEWDKQKRQKESYKKKMLERSRLPEQREKQRKLAIAYRDRRRVVARALYQRKKDDPDFRNKQNEYSKKKYRKMKESFDDNYIKKVLKIYKDATPEMIETKRLEIIELRKIREKIKEEKEHLSNELEKRKKDREARGIIKICSYHGELTADQTYIVSNGKKCINKIHRCKMCNKEKSLMSYRKNIDHIKDRHKIYAEKNKDKVIERTKRWYIEMSDAYIKRLLTKNTELKSENITQDLIELKKVLLKIKRKRIQIIRETKNV